MEARQAAHGAADEAREDARGGRSWFAALARAGLVAKGVSYGLVGVLAIKLALGSGGQTTSREGALATLAREPFGKVVLALLAAGFASDALWRLVAAVVESDDDGKAKQWASRGAKAARAVVYAGLTFGAVKILLGAGGNQSDNDEARQTSATILSWPAGTWIVGAAGVAIIGFGAWNAYEGLARKFEEKWRLGAMGGAARTWGRGAGIAGHVARGTVFALIGGFLIKAAVEYDPDDAIGLDGALNTVAGAAYGPYLLGVVAAGLVCYGAFCLADARYRDVSAD